MQSEFTAVHLGKLAIFEMGQSPPSAYVSEGEIGLPFLQGNAEFGAVYPTPGHYCSQPQKLCQPGDVLISVRAPVGELNKADQTYVIGRGLAAVRFTEIPLEFGWHLLNYWARDLHQLAQGSTFKAISKGNLESLSVLLPPLPEQRRIAEILDAADEAIRQTERVIAKLKAVKAGLLHDLLTCGLDEHGHLRDPQAHPEQFKDSPLGRVPENWSTDSLGNCSFVTKLAGFEYTNYFDYSKHGEIIAVRVLNIRDGRLDLSDVHTIPRSVSDKLPRSALKKGDLVISYVGTIGEVALIEEGNRFHLAPNVARISPSRDMLDPCFLLMQLLSHQAQKRLFDLSALTSQPALSMGRLRRLQIVIPPLEEQTHIAATLDAHDTRIRAEEAELAKLRQVKRGLMDDLLTGRVRVT